MSRFLIPNPDAENAAMFRTAVAQRIATARKNAGLTQGTLGELVGCVPSTITHYELGNTAPTLEVLRRIAAALGTTIGHLVGETQ